MLNLGLDRLYSLLGAIFDLTHIIYINNLAKRIVS